MRRDLFCRRAAAVWVGAAVLGGLILLGATAGAEPRTFRLDNKKSQLVVHLLKDGLGARLAHDHVIRARSISGEATVDPESPAASSIRVTVDARTLAADEPWLRKKYGMKEMLDAGDRGEVEKNMKAKGQLYTDRYPQIRFVSKALEPRGEGRYAVRGTLTIRGVSRPVSLTVKARVVGERFKASGQLRFKQSDFGYKPYSAAGGLVKVKDRATLNIYLEGAPAKASSK